SSSRTRQSRWPLSRSKNETLPFHSAPCHADNLGHRKSDRTRDSRDHRAEMEKVPQHRFPLLWLAAITPLPTLPRCLWVAKPKLCANVRQSSKPETPLGKHDCCR